MFWFKKKKGNIELTKKDLDFFGESLASWANENHLVISINKKEINSEMPNAGGFSQVAYSEYEYEKNSQNLRDVIQNSSCDISFLKDYFRNLVPTKPKRILVKELSRLGRFSFNKVSHGRK